MRNRHLISTIARVGLPIVFAMLLIPTDAIAQGLYESSKGESSIVLAGGGIGLVNFTDSNVKFGYSYQVSDSPWLVGAEFKLNFKKGFASLLDDGDVSVEDGEGSVFVGYQWRAEGPQPEGFRLEVQRLFVRVGYTHGTFLLAASEEDGGFATSERVFNGGRLGVHYNALGGFKNGDTFLFGASIIYGKRHNISKLTPGQICSSLGEESDEVLESLQTCKAVSVGIYNEPNEANAAVDVLWYPPTFNSRLAFAFILRHDQLRYERAAVPGFGIFFTKDGIPLQMLGGFTVEFDEPGATVGIQLGIPF